MNKLQLLSSRYKGSRSHLWRCRQCV